MAPKVDKDKDEQPKRPESASVAGPSRAPPKEEEPPPPRASQRGSRRGSITSAEPSQGSFGGSFLLGGRMSLVQATPVGSIPPMHRFSSRARSRSIKDSASRVLHLGGPPEDLSPTPTPTPSTPSTPSPVPSEVVAVRPRRRRTCRERCNIPRCLPVRCVFAFMALISFAIVYGLKVNLSLAIVAMVEEETGNSTSPCKPPQKGEKELVPGAKYVWDANVQGFLLSSYFWGYLVSQIPGAILADMYSAKWVMWFAVAVNVVGCALTPAAAMATWGAVLLVRFFQGAAAGVTFPAMHIMISNWAPPLQQSVFTGTIYAGTAVGMVGSTLLSGFLSSYVGWENMFYIMALMCVPWCIFWILWIEDSPTHRVYGKERASMARASMARASMAARASTAIDDASMEFYDKHTHSHRKLKFPLQEVLTSLPFWAILVAHVGGNCGLYCFITQVPSFMKKYLQKDLKSNATLSTIPYIAMFVVSNAVGPPLDALRSRGKITTTTARKIGATIALLIPAGCLVALSTIGCDVIVGIIYISVAVGAIGAMNVAHLSNHIDIAPNYAGLLMGITNTLATIPGITVPVMLGNLTKDDNSLERWMIGFYAIAAVYLFSFLFYVVFASGNVQYWNSPEIVTERRSARASARASARGSRASAAERRRAERKAKGRG